MKIFDIFRKSPFQSLQEMMNSGNECVKLITPIFDAFLSGKEEEVQRLAEEISDKEYETDIIKNEIRSSLPNSIFMSVARGDVLEIITSIDAIADAAEDVGVLLSFKMIKVPSGLVEKVKYFVEKVIDVANLSKTVVDELETLRESSFAGPETKHITELLDKLNQEEHKTDKLGYEISKIILNTSEQFNFADLWLWLKIIQATSDVANAAEKLGNRIRLIISK
ncbi:MAG: TIGR00153 family protein [Desulfurellaceae bacterium]|jgi:predicted phosphate transport protein (TIGR00153 family)|nr:TIGR00153 family protein [Desulfurellaceae bacterium]